jgi:hypothetical protein
MQRVNIYAAVLGFVLAAMAPVALADERLFFFGNSYSYFNKGLDTMVKTLLEEATPNTNVQTGRFMPNGGKLRRQLLQIDGTMGDTAERRALITGDNIKWDLVVLQDQSRFRVSSRTLGGKPGSWCRNA